MLFLKSYLNITEIDRNLKLGVVELRMYIRSKFHFKGRNMKLCIYS